MSISAQAQREAGCHTSALSGPRCIKTSLLGCCRNWQESKASPGGRPADWTPCRPGPAEWRLPVQAAPREWHRAPSWLDPFSIPAAAARRPREVADRATLDLVKTLQLLGPSTAGHRQARKGGRPRDPMRVPGQLWVPGHVVMICPLDDGNARPKGESPALAITQRSTSAVGRHLRLSG